MKSIWDKSTTDTEDYIDIENIDLSNNRKEIKNITTLKELIEQQERNSSQFKKELEQFINSNKYYKKTTRDRIDEY